MSGKVKKNSKPFLKIKAKLYAVAVAVQTVLMASGRGQLRDKLRSLQCLLRRHPESHEILHDPRWWHLGELG